MLLRWAIACVICLFSATAALPAHARFAKTVRAELVARFVPAMMHRGLLTAQEPLEHGKLRGFVVIERDGLPADKAYWFITNQEYSYRPVIIADDTITTRGGLAYMFLKRGQVMAVTGIEYSGQTVYLKLLSPEPVVPPGRRERFPSRVATMVGFKFPKAVADGDPAAVLATIESWVKPFPDRAGAEAYAAPRSP
ncbi:MAG: hypothetical protein HYV03_04370 [Deltaproteobacteria bacterium]|nr:hypothetical protein [Deltaproteobacteria bacterium]